MPETQGKIGHLWKMVPNAIKRGGREIPGEGQPKIGWLHSQNRQDKAKGGAYPDQNTSHGFREAIREAPSVRRVNDHVRKIDDEY